MSKKWPLAGDIPAEIQAMFAHHDQLSGELRGHVDALVETVRDGDDFGARRTALCRYIDGEVIPHALAEEDAIYSAGAAVSELKPLVDGMLMEHGALVELAGEATSAADGLAASNAAAAFVSLFEVHVAKENDLLLPALVAGGTDPAGLLQHMHKAFAERKAQAARTTAAPKDGSQDQGLRAAHGEQVVDTRIDTGQACATLATNAVDALPVGSSFVLVSDHDPIGIHYMLKAERAGQTSWDVLEGGPTRWQVRIGREAAASA